MRRQWLVIRSGNSSCAQIAVQNFSCSQLQLLQMCSLTHNHRENQTQKFICKISIRDLYWWLSAGADWRPLAWAAGLAKMCGKWGMQHDRKMLAALCFSSDLWSCASVLQVGWELGSESRSIRKSLLLQVTAIEFPNDTSNITLCTLSQHSGKLGIITGRTATLVRCLPACWDCLEECGDRWSHFRRILQLLPLGRRRLV